MQKYGEIIKKEKRLYLIGNTAKRGRISLTADRFGRKGNGAGKKPMRMHRNPNRSDNYVACRRHTPDGRTDGPSATFYKTIGRESSCLPNRLSVSSPRYNIYHFSRGIPQEIYARRMQTVYEIINDRGSRCSAAGPCNYPRTIINYPAP